MQIFTPAKHDPLHDNNTVQVLRDEAAGDKQSEGGIFIPGRAVEIANQGEVRAAAEGSQYQIGDRVIFTKYAGSTIELNGIEYVLLKEKEIQGTVETIGDPTKTLEEQKDDLKAALAQFDEQAKLGALASTA